MIENNEAIIDQREREINQIARSIHQLAEIFRDLQTLVIDQGTMLDRIDYNIEQTAVQVKHATVELDKVGNEMGHAFGECVCVVLIMDFDRVHDTKARHDDVNLSYC